MEPCALTVAFVEDPAIKGLNATYRNRDYATDVLSFAYGREGDEDIPYLGDIVIAPGVASEHARSRGVAVDDELRRLLVHGVLHLLGYDHETDSGEMVRLQAKLLRRRRIAGAGRIVSAAEARGGISLR